jgi:hypothetical protein
MKKWPLIIGAIVLIVCGILIKYYHPHKHTEPECREIAQFCFQRYCAMINYETNEFVEPKITIGKSNEGEPCYSFLWAHKSENVDVLVVVSEFGYELAGGPGRLDYNKPETPRRLKKTLL